MLSPTTDEATKAPIRGEERRKRKVEVEERNTAKLLFVLKEMKDEMRERDEHLREVLRWRDNHLDE